MATTPTQSQEMKNTFKSLESKISTLTKEMEKLTGESWNPKKLNEDELKRKTEIEAKIATYEALKTQYEKGEIGIKNFLRNYAENQKTNDTSIGRIYKAFSAYKSVDPILGTKGGLKGLGGSIYDDIQTSFENMAKNSSGLGKLALGSISGLMKLGSARRKETLSKKYKEQFEKEQKESEDKIKKAIEEKYKEIDRIVVDADGKIIDILKSNNFEDISKWYDEKLKEEEKVKKDLEAKKAAANNVLKKMQKTGDMGLAEKHNSAVDNITSETPTSTASTSESSAFSDTETSTTSTFGSTGGMSEQTSETIEDIKTDINLDTEYLDLQTDYLKDTLKQIENIAGDNLEPISDNIKQIENNSSILGNFLDKSRESDRNLGEETFEKLNLEKLETTVANLVSEFAPMLSTLLPSIETLSGIITSLNSTDINDLFAKVVEEVVINAGLSLPQMAKGGVVTKPTKAIVGEGGEPEAIVPLSKAGNIFGGNQTSADFEAQQKRDEDTSVLRDKVETIVEYLLEERDEKNKEKSKKKKGGILDSLFKFLGGKFGTLLASITGISALASAIKSGILGLAEKLADSLWKLMSPIFGKMFPSLFNKSPSVDMDVPEPPTPDAKNPAGKTGKTGKAPTPKPKAKGSILKSAGKLVGNAGKSLVRLGGKLALPVAAAMTAWDGISGYSNEELHREMFGLKEGEKATTMQKLGAGLSSIASGLTFGALDATDIHHLFTSNLFDPNNKAAQRTLSKEEAELKNATDEQLRDMAVTNTYNKWGGAFPPESAIEDEFNELKKYRDSLLEKHAEGGIVTEEHRAIVGEKGPEAILPLDDFYKREDRKEINAIVREQEESAKMDERFNPLQEMAKKAMEFFEDTSKIMDTLKDGVTALVGDKFFGEGGGGVPGTSPTRKGSTTNTNTPNSPVAPGAPYSGNMPQASNTFESDGYIDGNSLGSLATKFEAGGRSDHAHDLGEVINGKRIGTSYGKYQITTAGNRKAFLDVMRKQDEEGAAMAAALEKGGFIEGLGDNHEAARLWKEYANSGKIQKYEDAFAKDHFFGRAMKDVKNDTLRQMIQKSPTLQKAMFSYSLQGQGVAGKNLNARFREGMTEKEVLDLMYDDRLERSERNKKNHEKGFIKGLRNRFGHGERSERLLAYKMLEDEKNNPNSIQQVPNQSSSTAIPPQNLNQEPSSSAGASTVPSTVSSASGGGNALYNMAKSFVGVRYGMEQGKARSGYNQQAYTRFNQLKKDANGNWVAGSKSGVFGGAGTMDCSQFVSTVMTNLGYGNYVNKAGGAHSAEMIRQDLRRKGFKPKASINQLQEGDVLFTFGSAHAGAGAAGHVAVAVRNPETGQLEIAESVGGKSYSGVQIRPISGRWRSGNVEIYGSPANSIQQEPNANGNAAGAIQDTAGGGESGSMQSQLADTSATQNPMTSGGQIQDTAQAGMNAQASAYYSSSSGATGNVNVTNVGGASSSSDKSGPLMTTPIDPMGWAVLQGTTVH